MLRGLFIFLSFLVLLPSNSFYSERNVTFGNEKEAIESETLIVFLSRTNNTKIVAEIIHDYIGGRLVELELETYYPKDYRKTVRQVARENEMGILPPLKTKIDSIEKYDIIFLGFPTWGMQLPPPMKSFLNQYDLRGKIIIPFNSNGGYGIGRSFEDVKDFCPKSKILEGYSTTGGSERDNILFVMKGKKRFKTQKEIKTWLQIINVLER